MKRLLAIFTLISILAVVGFAGEWETHYTRLAVCTDVNYCINEATFTDNDGHIWIWELEKTDYFCEGKAYRLYMSNSHTMSIYDDYIREIKEY